MKILYITPFYPPDQGGISIHVRKICDHLKSSHDISIVSPKKLFYSCIKNDEIQKIYRISSIYFVGWPYSTLKSLSFPLNLVKLQSLISSHKFELVHVHGHHYPISWIGIYLAHKHDIPSILSLHGMYALNPNNLGGRTRMEDVFNGLFLKRILRRTNAVIGLTDSITGYAKNIDSTPKYYTIPNGVDTQVYKKNLGLKKYFRNKYNINSDKPTILFCGRLEQVKGIAEFVSAIKFLTRNDLNFQVLIVGTGSLKHLVISELGKFKNVHIFGWQHPDIIHEFYLASDIFVLPSKFEALPITIIEAMNANLHIIYNPVGGITDILKGYTPKMELINDSVNELISSISNAVNNYTEPDTMSLEYARSFDWVNISNRIQSIYEEFEHLRNY